MLKGVDGVEPIPTEHSERLALVKRQRQQRLAHHLAPSQYCSGVKPSKCHLPSAHLLFKIYFVVARARAHAQPICNSLLSVFEVCGSGGACNRTLTLV